jgi:WD40 repeat protein
MTPPLQHQDVVYAATFIPDGTHIVTASRDKTARVWDALAPACELLPLCPGQRRSHGQPQPAPNVPTALTANAAASVSDGGREGEH